jgi:adenylate cyclase
MAQYSADQRATDPLGSAEPSPGRTILRIVLALVLLVLAGLPLAVWQDLRTLTEHTLKNRAHETLSVINSIRSYYASNVVGRLLGGDSHRVLPNYADMPGAIPIPATLSLELGSAIARNTGDTQYRFFSDLPFAHRAAHPFDDFERNALAALRQGKESAVYEVSGTIFDRRVRMVTPVLMEAPCVACHNSHPDSPKRDWKVGDVRGIQEIVVDERIADNIFAFRSLLIYFLAAAIAGAAFVMLQHHQGAVIRRINAELARANALLSAVADKIGKYISPQLYRSIFSGDRDVTVSTERKKLTIFFSDIVGFTAATERLQPEELTSLLNEYLTEMAEIATRHGGTVNKFIGDAILVFFGDPESRGVGEDARACLQMAFEMQRRLAALNGKWRNRGIEEPFLVRIGINTGYCNVGNFGSSDRLDYTIIGAEANLAARLQSIAEPGRIVVSYETFALVRDIARLRPLAPIAVKGIARPIVPYVVEGPVGEEGAAEVISEHAAGLDLFLDIGAVDAAAASRMAQVLESAAAALRSRGGSEASPS